MDEASLEQQKNGGQKNRVERRQTLFFCPPFFCSLLAFH
jgi:hypothetical protein